ncbi:hypothetical protein CC2G_007605 [Coprinopsis cinerea AmutBmut pab1-1]|nr:hypothetical protein CC2G_007605 [Coprinopsis cinerea AmutBmut pab1-1]
MVDFFGSSNATLSSADMVAKKEAVKRQIQAETGLAQAQELMNNSTEKCYARCIVTPGNDLSNKDKVHSPSTTLHEYILTLPTQTCLASCFDKYLQAFNTVSRTYTARVQRERLQQQHQHTETIFQ